MRPTPSTSTTKFRVGTDVIINDYMGKKDLHSILTSVFAWNHPKKVESVSGGTPLFLPHFEKMVLTGRMTDPSDT